MKEYICAILISYNCDEKILLVVENIINQIEKIVIIDNGSNIQSKKILNKMQGSNIEIIYNTKNMGIAYALNQGIKYAQSNAFDWIITLDQDSIATKNMVNNMLLVYNSLNNMQKSKVVSIVPDNVEEKNYNENEYTKNNKRFDEVLTEITSGNLLKVSVFDKIGYFEEKLFIDCVDHDFCFRINQNDYKIIKVYDAVLLHNLGNITTKKILSKNIIYSNHSFIRRYYITRNRFYIWNTYGNDFVVWTKNDKKAAILDLIMIILYENDKILKLKMIIQGYIDFKKNHFGELKL